MCVWVGKGHLPQSVSPSLLLLLFLSVLARKERKRRPRKGREGLGKERTEEKRREEKRTFLSFQSVRDFPPKQEDEK